MHNITGPSSPGNSFAYVYGDQELYLDSPSTSSSTSPMESSYDLQYPGYYGADQIDTLADSNSPDAQQAAPKAAAKRKRENRYKNAPPSVLSRRRAQNRASQRAYRERKDQRIKDLEVLLSEAQQKNDVLSQAYTALQTEYIKLKSEQDTTNHFQQTALAYDPSVGASTADLDLYLYPDASGYGVEVPAERWS